MASRRFCHEKRIFQNSYRNNTEQQRRRWNSGCEISHVIYYFQTYEGCVVGEVDEITENLADKIIREVGGRQITI